MCRFLGGTAIPRIQLDLIPGLFCGAYFVIKFRADSSASHQAKDLLEAGGRLQRFWLTATALGLAVQPTIAPLCFAYYGRTSRSTVPAFKTFAASAEDCIPGNETVLFLGRIGVPKRMLVTARSVRRHLADYITR